MRWILLLLLLPLTTACQTVPTEPKNLEWRHMVGSNSDELWVTEVLFYRQGKLVDASTNGSAGFFGAEGLKEKTIAGVFLKEVTPHGRFRIRWS